MITELEKALARIDELETAHAMKEGRISQLERGLTALESKFGALDTAIRAASPNVPFAGTYQFDHLPVLQLVSDAIIVTAAGPLLVKVPK